MDGNMQRRRTSGAWIAHIPLLAGVILTAGCGSGGGGSAPVSDAPGITRNLPAPTLAVTEGGALQTYTLSLNSAPSAEVSITFTTGPQIALTPSVLVFTPADWNVVKEVSVAAVNDDIAQGPHSDTIRHSVMSGDSRYGGLGLSDVAVNITDNDTPGIRIAETAGTTQATEGGATDSYTLALMSQPSGDVTFTPSAGGLLALSPAILHFNANNWNLPQTVTVTAVDNGSVEGAHSAVIAHSATSGDGQYNGLGAAPLNVQIIDNDTIATLDFLGDDAVVSEGDGSITVPVRLRLNAAVTLPNPVVGTVTVAASSTARNVVDVALQSSGVSFGVGSSDGAIQPLVINLLDDALKEPVEGLDLRLAATTGAGAVLGSRLDYRINLYDNERPQLIASAVTPFGGYSRSHLLGIEPATAGARRLSGLGLAGLAGITGTAFDPATNTFYAVANGELVKINLNTGIGNVIGASPINAGLAFDTTTNTLYGSGLNTLYTLNTSTGAATAIGAYGAFTAVEGLAFKATGELYGSDTAANALLSIDKGSGAATQVGLFGITGIAGLAFGPGTTLYAASTLQDRLYTVDIATGAAAAVGAQALGFDNVATLSYVSPANTLYGFDSVTRQLIALDTATGVGQTYKVIGHGNVFGTPITGMAYDASRQAYYGVGANAFGDQYLLRVQAQTGTATSIAKVSGATGTFYGLAYDNDAGRLYGVGGGGLYRIDTSSAVATLVGNTGGNPRGLAFDAENDILYATDTNTDQLLTLDTGSGAQTPIGNLGFGDVEGLAIDFNDPNNANDNVLFGIDTDPIGDAPRLIRINTANGAASAVGDVLHEDLSGALAYDTTHDRLYGANKLGVLRLDTGSGRGTSVGQLGAELMADLAYDANTGVLYAAVTDSDDGKLVTVDLATGATRPVGVLGTACCVDGLAFNPDNNALYGVDTASGQLVTINTANGTVGAMGAMGYDRVAGALAYDPDTNTLYGIGGTDTGGTGTGPYTYQLISINITNGAGTPIAPIGYDGITALAYDPDTDTLYAYDETTTQLVTLNTVSGNGTPIGRPGYDGIRGLTWRR